MLETAIGAGIKSVNALQNGVGKFGKLAKPFERILNKLDTVAGKRIDTKGIISELVTETVLDLSGLFQDGKVFSLQNPQGNGLDVIAKTKDGLWVPFEVKATGRNNNSALSKASKPPTQRDGADRFTSDRLDRIANRRNVFKSVDSVTQARAQNILNDFLASGQRVFRGFVVQVTNFQQTNQKVEFRLWERNARTGNQFNGTLNSNEVKL